MDPKRQQEIDQAAAEARESYPALWWALHAGCLEKGFTPEQAFALVQTYILANGSRPLLCPDPTLLLLPKDTKPDGD